MRGSTRRPRCGNDAERRLTVVTTQRPHYDVAADGRFLVLESIGGGTGASRSMDAAVAELLSLN